MTIFEGGIFLNSIPKAGTVLLNNILMQFVDSERKIVQPWMTAATLNHDAFKDLRGKFFVGHLPYSAIAWLKVRNSRQLLLVRDPKSVCLAYTRFYASREMLGRSQLTNFIEERQPSMSDVLRLMLTGWSIGTDRHPPVLNVWHGIVKWAYLNNVRTVAYEELILRLREAPGPASQAFFQALLAHVGVDIDDFPDWAERVARGAKPEESNSYRGNLNYLIPVERFPSPEDLAVLDLEYSHLSEMYNRTFLRRDLG